MQKCPYYYELYAIMSECSSTMPIALFDSMQSGASVNIREERQLDDSNRDKVVPEAEKSLNTVFGEKMGTTTGDTELVLKCRGCSWPWHHTSHDCSDCTHGVELLQLRGKRVMEHIVFALHAPA